MLTAIVAHVFAWLQLKSNRAFELRQEVYLEAAAALANSLRFFYNVSNLDVEDSQLATDIHPVSMSEDANQHPQRFVAMLARDSEAFLDEWPRAGIVEGLVNQCSSAVEHASTQQRAFTRARMEAELRSVSRGLQA